MRCDEVLSHDALYVFFTIVVMHARVGCACNGSATQDVARAATATVVEGAQQRMGGRGMAVTSIGAGNAAWRTTAHHYERNGNARSGDNPIGRRVVCEDVVFHLRSK